MTSPVTTRPMTPDDLPLVAALHAEVFGPGRFARSAYRVREGRQAGATRISGFCRVASLGRRLVAALTLTPVAIGEERRGLLLGPLAVSPEIAGQGYGRRLVAEAIDAAKSAGFRLVVLVGDEPYYGRFGFRAVPPGQIEMPGPANPARVLAAELVPGALAAARGTVQAIAV